jgi:hypothetical protein
MSARRTTLLVLSLALVAAALSLGTAKANAATPGSSAFFDTCAYAPADMTGPLISFQLQEAVGAAAVGLAATPVAGVASGGYNSPYCGLIDDVIVHATERPMTFWLEAGTAYLINDPDECNALTVQVMIYKSAGLAANSFTRVMSGRLRGSWNNSICGLTPISGDLPGALFATSTAVSFDTGTGIYGNAVYRVAVSTWESTPSGNIPLQAWADAGY